MKHNPFAPLALIHALAEHRRASMAITAPMTFVELAIAVRRVY